MRIKSLLLSLIMLISCCSFTLPASASSMPEAATTVLYENFDADSITNTDGVFTYAGEHNITFEKSSGYKVPVFESDGNGGYVMRTNTDANTRIRFYAPEIVDSGVAIFELDVMFKDDTNKTSNIYMYSDASPAKDTGCLTYLITGAAKIRNPEYSGDTPISKNTYVTVRLIADIDNSKYYVQYGDGILHTNMPADKYSFSNAKFFMTHTPSGSTEPMYIDNVRIHTAESMASHVVYPAMNAENVEYNTNIKINFSQQMEKTTLAKENFVLKNETTGEPVAFTVKESDADCAVTIVPSAELLPECNYTLTATDSLTNKAGESYSGVLADFTTKAIKIENKCFFTMPYFEDDNAFVTVNNSTNAPVTAEVISVLYEVSEDGYEIYRDSESATVTIPAEGSYPYGHSEFSTESDKNYVVRYYLWDSLQGKKVLAKSAVAGGESTEADEVYTAANEGITVSNINEDSASFTFGYDFNTPSEKRISYVIKNPIGAIAYIGQTTTEGGAFEQNLRLKKGSFSGTYTIEYLVAGLEADSISFELDLSNAKPTATGVNIAGIPFEGQTLKGNYNYFHIGDLPMESASFAWYVSEREIGGYTQIKDENGENLDTDELYVSNEYQGKYIKFGVTVTTATVPGSEVLSDPIKISVPPTVTDVGIDGDVKRGEIVSADYNYDNPDNLPMDKMEVRWLKKHNDTEIELGTGESYRIRVEAGSLIAVEVVLYSEIYSEDGKKSYRSDWVEVGEGLEPIEAELMENILYENFDSDSVSEVEGVLTYTSKNAIKFETSTGYSPCIFIPDGNDGYVMTHSLTTNTRPYIYTPDSIDSGVVIYEMDIMAPDGYSKTSNVYFYSDNNGTSASQIAYMITATPALRNPDYSGDKAFSKNEYLNVRLVLDIDNSKYYVQYSDGILHDNMNASKYTFKNANRFMLHIPSGNDAPLYIDNVRIYTADSMKSYVPHPMMNEKNVACDTNIEIDFTQQMNKATLIKENFVLKNETTGENVAFTVLNANDCSVVIKPYEALMPECNYTFTALDAVLNTDGKSYGGLLTSFTTDAVEIEDVCSLLNPSFADGNASVTINNSSEENVNAEIISVLYEVSSDGYEIYADSKTASVSIPANGSYPYTYAGFTTTSDKKYVVRYYLWDSLAGKNILSKSAVAGGEAKEADSAYMAALAPISVSEANNDTAYVSFGYDFESTFEKRIAYVIKNPDGTIAYVGQSTSKGGILNEALKFKKGTPSGNYTIEYRVAGLDAENLVFNLDLTAAKPTSINVKIDGILTTGETLTGNYEYFHVNSVVQSSAVFTWYISDSIDGEYKPITGKTGKTLEVTDTYVLKYLKFGVITKTSSQTGDEVFSAPVKILSKPSVSDVKISGTVKSGETVSVSYKYYHPENAEMDRVEVRWIKKSSSSETVIGTGSSYKISEAAGSSIAVEVTPYSKIFPQHGESVRSPWCEVKGGTSPAGSSSGGGGGGSAVSVSKPENEETEKTGKYTDVPQEHWAAESINILAEKGIVTGTGEGTFEPERTVNRAEFVTMIVRALGIELVEETTMDDVNSGDWYYQTVNSAVKAGLVSGYEGKFRPMDSITREEMAVILSNALKYKGTATTDAEKVSEFTDVDSISSWAVESIKNMVKEGMLTGFEDNSFRAKELTTRAQAATVILRLIEK